jgi:GT2 family glycosyltransferase
MRVPATVMTRDDGTPWITFPPPAGSRVAIIVPTKNRGDLLRLCIESIEATVPNHMARIVVVDHESTDADTLRYLETIRRRHCVVPFAGTFNFSKIINHGVATACQEGCFSHYLLLNNDVEALEPGWLERMVGLASRKEVGVVGALLVYPDRVVKHACVVVGLHYAADNRGKGWRAFDAEGRRLLGPERRLISVQDQAAVTGACMLLRAAVYEQLGGMDERFAVGFGDVDLCLRARALGYKVLLDAHSILVHHESATRGQAMGDPHPCDTLKFRLRYAREIQTWDAFTNPNQSRLHGNAPSSSARSRWNAAMHTVEVTLPSIVVDEQALPSSRRRAA